MFISSRFYICHWSAVCDVVQYQTVFSLHEKGLKWYDSRLYIDKYASGKLETDVYLKLGPSNE